MDETTRIIGKWGRRPTTPKIFFSLLALAMLVSYAPVAWAQETSSDSGGMSDNADVILELQMLTRDIDILIEQKELELEAGEYNYTQRVTNAVTAKILSLDIDTQKRIFSGEDEQLTNRVIETASIRSEKNTAWLVVETTQDREIENLNRLVISEDASTSVKEDELIENARRWQPSFTQKIEYIAFSGTEREREDLRVQVESYVKLKNGGIKPELAEKVIGGSVDSSNVISLLNSGKNIEEIIKKL
ncbi:MAG: hypothetical protein NTU61_04580 [Candidatus Altiarchaeota archaeon]|nr:hypothetical protein [Candidatus Altiarchaeota archaeon]